MLAQKPSPPNGQFVIDGTKTMYRSIFEKRERPYNFQETGNRPRTTILALGGPDWKVR
jgi:hypothetical protein